MQSRWNWYRNLEFPVKTKTVPQIIPLFLGNIWDREIFSDAVNFQEAVEGDDYDVDAYDDEKRVNNESLLSSSKSSRF